MKKLVALVLFVMMAVSMMAPAMAAMSNPPTCLNTSNGAALYRSYFSIALLITVIFLPLRSCTTGSM